MQYKLENSTRYVYLWRPIDEWNAELMLSYIKDVKKFYIDFHEVSPEEAELFALSLGIDNLLEVCGGS